MTDRIQRLATKTVNGEIWFETTVPEFDRLDYFLDPEVMSAKRSAEFVLAQTPIINDDTALTGYLRFEDVVLGDIFTRTGHPNFATEHRHFTISPLMSFAPLSGSTALRTLTRCLK